jgi:Mrp family chromosome partitioning ATPase
MRPSTAEALKAAIRRNLPLAIVLVLIGALVVNGIRQLQGPRYEASARVFHSTTNIGAALTNVQPNFVDPERVIETAVSLARSPEPYERAERSLGDETAATLRDSTSVTSTEDSDVIEFSTTLDEAQRSIRAVNTIASEYIEWRDEIFGADVRQSIARVQEELRRTTSQEEELREQLDRLRVLETLNSGGAGLVEKATDAPKVSPRPIRDTMLGAAFGFVVALLLAGVREALNTRVRSEADVEDSLKRPVLATIQTLPKRAGLVTVGRYESHYGDTYALLAANLMKIRSRRRPMVLAVTSAIAREGKTTTASNLAVAMAQRGQRVVLADFDLRKPSIARLFRIPSASPGVLQLVDGHAVVEQALWSVPVNGAAADAIRLPRLQSAVSGNGGASEPDTDAVEASENGGWLGVVPSGGSERGARIARSPRVAEVLAELTKDADVVILDTPPALVTVEMAELSRMVNSVLVVVRHGQVTRRSLLALSRQADTWQSEIVGAVLTDAPSEEDDYYYYGRS